MKPYKYTWTPQEDDRIDLLMKTKLEMEAKLEQVKKELISLIYKAEKGRV